MPMAEDWAVYNQSRSHHAYQIAVATELILEQIPEVKKCWHESSAKGHWVSGPANVEISLTIVASN